VILCLLRACVFARARVCKDELWWGERHVLLQLLLAAAAAAAAVAAVAVAVAAADTVVASPILIADCGGCGGGTSAAGHWAGPS
jgi:hypothetical protein